MQWETHSSWARSPLHSSGRSYPFALRLSFWSIPKLRRCSHLMPSHVQSRCWATSAPSGRTRTREVLLVSARRSATSSRNATGPQPPPPHLLQPAPHTPILRLYLMPTSGPLFQHSGICPRNRWSAKPFTHPRCGRLHLCCGRLHLHHQSRLLHLPSAAEPALVTVTHERPGPGLRQRHASASRPARRQHHRHVSSATAAPPHSPRAPTTAMNSLPGAAAPRGG